MSPLTRSVSLRISTLIFLVLTPLALYYLHQSNTIPLIVSCIRRADNSVAQYVRIIESTNAKTSRGSRNRTILFWTKMFSSDNFYYGPGNIFEPCPVSQCYATNNRTYLNVEDFDVVMFHAPEIDVNDLPKTRSSHQLYIFNDFEVQPMHPVRDYAVYRNFFNWTMTYRRDSTFMRPYGVVREASTNEVIPPHIPAVWKNVSAASISEEARKTTAGKTLLMAWFVSNCKTSSEREKYVEKLGQHARIDIYGRCGPLKCDCSTETECFEMVEKKYYFYLAFENSLCRDYVTEKAFNFLQYDVVPVVYGGADYKSTLPPGSYIDVKDFSSPGDLADFLLALSQNTERYLGYFKWKKFYKVEIKPQIYNVCEFCKKLHEERRTPEVIDDVFGWWIDNDCVTPEEFFDA